jgi:tetratricopeptide (TPR) repeat protein
MEFGMALDPYASCPCGSGKKFKWCCQPIHVDIDRAYRQDAEGQHEAALKIMEEVVAAHPANPEAWGRRAHLLYQNGQAEEAEKSIEKAFECNPNYPFGLFLRGVFRYHEGEIAGANLLFRRAAEVYDPAARDALAQVYGMIADCELKLNRPVAARAAMQIAIRSYPADEDFRKGFEQIFGPESTFPAIARRDQTFLPPAPTISGHRREAWDRALAVPATGRLNEAARAFEQLTREDEQDAAAWFNLGLARAWLGENPAAVESLDRYVTLEPDEEKAGEAWVLAEVLRCGHGMEEQADYRDYSAAYQIRDPQAVFGLLQQFEDSRRMVAMQANEQEGILSALVVEPAPVLTAGSAGGQMVTIQSYIMILRDLLRVWFPKKETFEKVRAEVQQKIGNALSAPRERAGPANFGDVVVEAVALPAGEMTQEEAAQRVGEHAARYFEDTWIHRPLRSLNLVPPIDAAGHGTLRKKLRGVVQFLQECASLGGRSSYDFDRLRRKLGLITTRSAPTGPGTLDISSMSAAELGSLAIETLPDDQLEQAYQAAQKLDARDLAAHFARSLVARPPQPERPDRYPWYAYLVQRAVGEGKSDDALSVLAEGQRYDSEQNEGRRRNEYELRRAQVFAKRGEAEPAQEAFDRLIAADPANLRYRSDAAEAMLSLRQGARALRFAEQGLAAARHQNNRDQEQYFLELTAAAKKQAG